MNWGKGIIIGMSLFMLFIIGMCVKMFRLPADEFDHHYYEKGLDFDRDYAKEKQVATDRAEPAIRIRGGVVRLTFARQAVGTARLVRPSSMAPDKTFRISTDGSYSAVLPLEQLSKGRWRIVLEWKSDHKSYLYEKELDL
jgi:hypothetical protein